MHFHTLMNTPPCMTTSEGCSNQPNELNWIGLSLCSLLWHLSCGLTVQSLHPSPKGNNILHLPGSGLMNHTLLPLSSHHNKSLRNVLVVLFIVDGHVTPLCWCHKSIARQHTWHYVIGSVLPVSSLIWRENPIGVSTLLSDWQMVLPLDQCHALSGCAMVQYPLQIQGVSYPWHRRSPLRAVAQPRVWYPPLQCSSLPFSGWARSALRRFPPPPARGRARTRHGCDIYIAELQLVRSQCPLLEFNRRKSIVGFCSYFPIVRRVSTPNSDEKKSSCDFCVNNVFTENPRMYLNETLLPAIPGKTAVFQKKTSKQWEKFTPIHSKVVSSHWKETSAEFALLRCLAPTQQFLPMDKWFPYQRRPQVKSAIFGKIRITVHQQTPLLFFFLARGIPPVADTISRTCRENTILEEGFKMSLSCILHFTILAHCFQVFLVESKMHLCHWVKRVWSTYTAQLCCRVGGLRNPLHSSTEIACSVDLVTKSW